LPITGQNSAHEGLDIVKSLWGVGLLYCHLPGKPKLLTQSFHSSNNFCKKFGR